MNEQIKKEEFEIDLVHIVKVLWQRRWIILLCVILLGAMLLSCAAFLVSPKYESTAMMYVNNSSVSAGKSPSISSSEITAAKSLLDVYIVILESPTTLEAVIEKAQLEYTYKELHEMVSASSVNGTEVFEITATSTDPREAKLIVDTIVSILPDRIAGVVEGSSVRLVNHANLPTQKASPSYVKYTAVGMILGFLISCMAIIVAELLDTTVRNEDYLHQRYSIPVLAVVPDSHHEASDSYNKYYKSENNSARKER